MFSAKVVQNLFTKELQTELKSKENLGGVVLYLVATIYTCYLSFKKIIDIPTWNALFWIIVVFSAINISSKLYQNDAKGRKYYLGFIASPLEIYFSKLLFNCFFIFLTSTIGYFIYSIVLGNVVNQFGIFFLVIVMGSLGFATLLTTVAAIASKGNGNFSLMAVLSFPMLIPYLITLIKFSKNVIDEINFTFNYKLLVIMFAIITLQVALSFLLIPYLWRD